MSRIPSIHKLLVLTGLAWLSATCLAQTPSPRIGVAAVGPIDLRIPAPTRSDVPGELPDARKVEDPKLAPSPTMLIVGKDYKISSNDLLEIEIPELDPALARKTVRVNAAGMISLPLIGAVSVAGLTSQEAETHIADRYREKYLQNPQVSVFLKEFTAERITMEGAVNRPGMYPVTGQITLLRAVAIAGGFAPIAKSTEVAVFRMNDQQVRERLIFDIEKIRAGEAEDPPVKGDDLIVVLRDSTRAMLKDSLLRDVIDTVNPFSILVPH
jgi:polysaccharide export outer membrane protein